MERGVKEGRESGKFRLPGTECGERKAFGAGEKQENCFSEGRWETLLWWNSERETIWSRLGKTLKPVGWYKRTR